jgi:hypothetical protein
MSVTFVGWILRKRSSSWRVGPTEWGGRPRMIRRGLPLRLRVSGEKRRLSLLWRRRGYERALVAAFAATA